MPHPLLRTAVRRAERGPLLATFTVTRAVANGGSRSRSDEFGAAAGAWAVADAGTEAGFSADPDRPRLRAPNHRPPGCFGLEAVGGDEFSTSVLPWFGELHQTQGVGGAVVGIDADTRVGLRTYAGQHPREIRVFGADTPVAVGATVRLYGAIH